MWIDIRPLRERKKFRWLYLGQMVSFFGNMVSHVAFPYQVYQLTKSSLAVGLIGIIQLGPLLLAGLYGGALADTFNRRRLLIAAEWGLVGLCTVLVWNSSREQPSLILIYVVAALNAIGFGLHRPAHESLTPRLVEKEDLPAVSVLASLRGNIGAIGGPAVGGILIAVYGTTAAYFLDLCSYIISLFCLWRMGDVPTTASLVGRASGWSGVVAGLQYVRKRRDLWGTYIVDIIAMTFGMPNALFPALAENLGGAKVLGWLYAAPSLGALVLTLGSGWTKKIRAYGKVITWSAALWGLAIVGAGWSSNLYAVLFFLALAGAFDMVSAIFRMTMWNETIPDEYRGRMAGVEMISYKSGPLLGQTESGLVAAWTSVRFSIVSGGLVCVLGVFLCAWWLPEFWHFTAQRDDEEKKPVLLPLAE